MDGNTNRLMFFEDDDVVTEGGEVTCAFEAGGAGANYCDITHVWPLSICVPALPMCPAS